jgi:hypothetical protein
MEGSCSTGQSPQWAVVPVEEEERVLKCYIKFFKLKDITLKISQNMQWRLVI